MSEKQDDPWMLTKNWSESDKELFGKILERYWYE